MTPAPTPIPTTTLRFEIPRVSGQTVRFAWHSDPGCELYRKSEFSLRFPSEVAIGDVPDGVWSRVLLTCLHTHWALIRPCRVVLPFRLPAGEREFWQRMIDAATWSLEARRKSEDFGFGARTHRAVEIVESGSELALPMRPQDTGSVAACFSGGRDSLTQLALLQELDESPYLVTVSSSREGSDEMVTERRRHVIDEIQRRRGVELVEVDSDLRGNIHNDSAIAKHYGAGVNEITDTFLYFSAAWVCAYARGSRAVYLASEAEVQESRRVAGVVAQHKHFMYSAATQAALSAVIAPSGITYSGLTYPLHQFQIQRLLGKRYADIRDLQYSCWSQRPGEDACSRCGECFTIAVNMLADGIDPSEIGIDVNELFPSQRDWWPESQDPEYARQPRSRRFPDDQALRLLLADPVRKIESVIAPDSLSAQALDAVKRLSATAANAAAPPPEPGFRAGYLDFVDPRVRDGLEAILEEEFSPEPIENYEELLHNSRILSDWVGGVLTRKRMPARDRARQKVDPVRAIPPRAIEPATEQLGPIADLIPGAEPAIERDGASRYLPVADTDLGGNELTYVTEAVTSNWVSSAGPYVERLEETFADFCGTKHAVTTASGASALEVMLRAVGIGAGDEVILPTFTMVATANAVHHVGATPVFVDSDLATWNMDLEQVRWAIGPRTRAILAMHTYGHPVDMDELRKLADANSIVLLEDAAEAHGATLHGRRAGSLSDAAAFSFYGNKIITTGEGGIITTDDDLVAETARQLRSHAFSADRHFRHRRRAFNFRMSNLQAAVGIAQMERIDEFLEKRRELARMYRRHLEPISGITLPPLQPGFESANWMFGILVDDDFGCSRDELRERLAADAIETRTFFVPLHIQPAYLDDNDGRRHPVAEQMGRQGLYLPAALWLEDSDVARIAERIAQAADAASRETSSPNFA